MSLVDIPCIPSDSHAAAHTIHVFSCAVASTCHIVFMCVYRKTLMGYCAVPDFSLTDIVSPGEMCTCTCMYIDLSLNFMK